MSLKEKSIREYLSGPREYEAGLQLYIKYGPSEALKKIFLFGATGYNHNKLIEALQSLLQSNTKPEASKKKDISPETPPPIYEKRNEKEKAQKSASRRKKPQKSKFKVSPNHPELVKFYRERATLKADLYNLESEQKRKETAFRILDLGEEIEAILFTGFPGDNLPKDRARLVQIKENNRKYISKNKSREDKGKEVKRRQMENEAIERKLNL